MVGDTGPQLSSKFIGLDWLALQKPIIEITKETLGLANASYTCCSRAVSLLLQFEGTSSARSFIASRESALTRPYLTNGAVT